MSKPFYRFILSLWLITFGCFCKAQSKTPPLERLVSITANNLSVAEVLKKVSEQGKFSFSYNSKTIDTERKINLRMENKPVRTVLHAIFRGSVIFKTKNNYIILSAAPPKENPEVEPKYLQVSGYTFDKPSSGKLKQVSILEENTLLSTVSDAYGYFILQVPNTTEKVKLKINKEGYKDTVLVLSKDFFQAIEIVLWPNPVKIESVTNNEVFIASADTTHPVISEENKDSKIKGFDFLLNSKMKSNLRNLTDTFFRKAQFSVIPPLSTNKLLGAHVMNNISFNLLAGYTAGVKYAEIAGLINVDRGDVSYFQAAGLANAVSGKTKGFQAAGLMNMCRGEVSGFQAAGLSNHTKHITGFQAAGLYNYSKSVKGVQAAGLFNYAREVKGAQLAGLFNYTKKLKGVQISPFNFADSSQGIPIGVFSFVKHGYHKIELSADEIMYGNIAFRTGVEKFHNIFSFGIGPHVKDRFIWSIGYGLGTSFKLQKKLFLDVDLTTTRLNRKFYPPAMVSPDTLVLASHNGLLNLNNKLYVGIDWRILKKISIAMGPTINLHLVDTRNMDYPEVFSELRPSYLSNDMVDRNIQMRVWIGGKIALRFL